MAESEYPHILQRERDLFRSIQRAINARIKWPKFSQQAMLALRGISYPLSRPHGYTGDSIWLRPASWAPLTEAERRFISDPARGRLRQKYLGLLFLKKLLGVLKQQINRELDALAPLEPHEEKEILGDLQSEFAANISPTPKPFCNHIHYPTRTRQFTVKGQTTLNHLSFCSNCNTLLSYQPGTEPKGPEPECQHKTARWVPGKEGQEARCGNPQCQSIVPHPEIYGWSRVGDEPFQDDPSKDELIYLDEALKEEENDSVIGA